MKPRVRRPWRAALLALALTHAAGAAADWTLEQPRGSNPRATATEANGASVALYRNGDDILLEFRIKPGFNGLAQDHCPTFQVDSRTPLFHAAVGKSCEMAADHAVITLARIAGRRLKSAPIDSLLNGEQVAFRYLTTDDTYRETRFSLKRSARAIRSAVGRNVRISGD